jgi:hypothetical protein
MGEATAVELLEAALAEQARCGEEYQRAVGTSAEQANFMRLQAAGLRVMQRDRAVKAYRREGVLLTSGEDGASST